ncbi:hypothetical protein [Sphingomonas mesophila]|uniref:hypothetical protein n=1 Tax=Sphingomonas mesophila TaxID=2303576 RepID=UPI000E592D4D|nr:hypothetical protein [Sphingomonas mesophila]
MAIRRLRQNVVEQNWFAVLIDIGIVVLGVFLGIQASNWNQGRQVRALANEYRQQIIADLDNNIADLTARRAYYNSARDRSIAALNALPAAPSPTGDERLTVLAYQASEVFTRPLVRGAYDEMTAAGMGPEVADLRLRARLSSYYGAMISADRTFQATTDYREQARRLLPTQIQQYLRSRCGDRVIRHGNGLRTATMADVCPLPLEPALIRLAAARLRSARELELDLNRHIADLDQKLLLFRGFLVLVTGLRADLSAKHASPQPT